MNTLKFALLSLMMVTQLTSNVVTSAPMRNQRNEKRINLIAAVNKYSKFTCNKPQPRSYHLEDLIPFNNTVKVSKPVYIVVTRCDTHSGCCNNRLLSCLPDNESVYYQEIEIEIRNDVKNFETKKWISVEQHANCRCNETSQEYRNKTVTTPPYVTFID